MLPDIYRQKLNTFGKNGKPFFFCIDYLGQRMAIMTLEELPLHGFRFSFPKLNDISKKKNVILQVHPPDYQTYLEKFYFLQEKIRDGYSVLANLTLAVEVECELTLKEIYFAACAPYRILKEDEFVCFSPETFVRIEGESIETRPMKGTRKISSSEQLASVSQELLSDEKEMAEHYAVTDLLRNDLNQVAKRVCVEKFRYLDIIPATGGGMLLQSSSLITGKIAKDWPQKLGDIFSRLLPAGSVTGAPKRESVRLLEVCEREPRGWYCGVAGYFDGDSLDSCVLIRFIEKRANKYFFRTGGGITIDSLPHLEYQELLEKVYVPLH